jgi:hypothetical protein
VDLEEEEEVELVSKKKKKKQQQTPKGCTFRPLQLERTLSPVPYFYHSIHLSYLDQ